MPDQEEDKRRNIKTTKLEHHPWEWQKGKKVKIMRKASIFNFQQAFKRKLILMKSVRLSQYACWVNNNHNDLSIEGDELNVFPILLPDGSRGGRVSVRELPV